MKTSQIKRCTTLAPQRSVFRLAPVAAGCAALLVAGDNVYAQQTDAASRAAASRSARSTPAHGIAPICVSTADAMA